MRKNRLHQQEFFLDGWAMLFPGHQVTLGEGSASPEPKRALMREVRGWYLGRGLEVEDGLVRLALAEEFATLDTRVHAEVSARAASLRRLDVTLRHRIDEAKPFIRAVLGSSATGVLQDLATHRRIRNMMAHQPSWLEGVWDADVPGPPGDPSGLPGRTIDYTLWIGDDEYIWSIDQAQIDEWAALINRCCAGLDSAVRAYLLQPIDGLGNSTPATPP